MPPRSLSERSPVSVIRWPDDCSTSSSVELKRSSKPQGAQSPLPLSKSVRFATETKTYNIPHLNDISDQEIYATWYNSQEYSAIKSAYQLTIFMMESGETVTGDEHTSRGLEYRTQEGAWARYENKRDAYNAVLDEQDHQWKIDKDDFEKIRKIYLKHSQKCADAAVVRALSDEREANEIFQSLFVKPKQKPRLKKTSKSSASERREKLAAPTDKKNERKSRSKSPAKKSRSSSQEKKSRSSSHERKSRSSSAEKKSRLTSSEDRLKKSASFAEGQRKPKSPVKSSAERRNAAVGTDKATEILRERSSLLYNETREDISETIDRTNGSSHI